MIYKCAVCGKEFYFSGDYYIYKKIIDKGKKVKVLHFCGWNCMRKYEREKESEKWMKN